MKAYCVTFSCLNLMNAIILGQPRPKRKPNVYEFIGTPVLGPKYVWGNALGWVGYNEESDFFWPFKRGPSSAASSSWFHSPERNLTPPQDTHPPHVDCDLSWENLPLLSVVGAAPSNPCPTQGGVLFQHATLYTPHRTRELGALAGPVLVISSSPDSPLGFCGCGWRSSDGDMERNYACFPPSPRFP